MATQAVSPASAEAEVRDSWVPMIVIAMGQMLMSFNVAAIPVSMGGMVASFNTPPTTVGTAAEAVRINTESRLRALKIGFLVLSGLALLALIPCGWLPDYRPGEIPSGPPSGKEDRS